MTFNPALVSQSARQKKVLKSLFILRKRKARPKGPNSDLIKAIVEIKQRNSRFGSPRIAFIINNTFGIDINKDIVRRVRIKLYHPKPGYHDGPS